MRAWILQALFLGLSLSAGAQEFYVLNWLEGDLDGDRVPERVVLLSDSVDPSNPRSRKELRVLKRRGDKLTTVHRMPLDDTGFSPRMEVWQFEDPGSRLWGLNYEPATKARRAAVMVCITPNSGNFFRLRFNGKTYAVEYSGD